MWWRLVCHMWFTWTRKELWLTVVDSLGGLRVICRWQEILFAVIKSLSLWCDLRVRVTVNLAWLCWLWISFISHCCMNRLLPICLIISMIFNQFHIKSTFISQYFKEGFLVWYVCRCHLKFYFFSCKSITKTILELIQTLNNLIFISLVSAIKHWFGFFILIDEPRHHKLIVIGSLMVFYFDFFENRWHLYL